jgi:hypothetical protein
MVATSPTVTWHLKLLVGKKGGEGSRSHQIKNDSEQRHLLPFAVWWPLLSYSCVVVVLRRCSVVSWSWPCHSHVMFINVLCCVVSCCIVVMSWSIVVVCCVVLYHGHTSHWPWHLDVQPEQVVWGKGWVFTHLVF